MLVSSPGVGGSARAVPAGHMSDLVGQLGPARPTPLPRGVIRGAPLHDRSGTITGS